jgi:hypothetical protein
MPGANAIRPGCARAASGEQKMIEIATFVRVRSGDLTTSGVFPEETRGLEENEEGDHFDERTK